MTLERILKKLSDLEDEVDLLPETIGESVLQEIKGLSFAATNFVPRLLMLSVAEQRTLAVLKTLSHPATADEIALLSHRARAVESMYLNGLHRRDMVLKERRGRKACFILKEEYRVHDPK